MKNWQKYAAIGMTAVLAAGLMTGCGSDKKRNKAHQEKRIKSLSASMTISRPSDSMMKAGNSSDLISIWQKKQPNVWVLK